MKRVITKHALAGGSDALLLRLLVGEDLIHQLGLFGQLAGEAGADIHVQHQRSAVALLGELLGGLFGVGGQIGLQRLVHRRHGSAHRELHAGRIQKLTYGETSEPTPLADT